MCRVGLGQHEVFQNISRLGFEFGTSGFEPLNNVEMDMLTLILLGKFI